MLIQIDAEKRTVTFDDKEIQYIDLYTAVVEVMKASGAAYFEDCVTELN